MRTAGLTLHAAHSFHHGPCPPRDKELIVSSCSLCVSAFPGPSLPGGPGRWGDFTIPCTWVPTLLCSWLGGLLGASVSSSGIRSNNHPSREGLGDRAGLTQKAGAWGLSVHTAHQEKAEPHNASRTQTLASPCPGRLSPESEGCCWWGREQALSSCPPSL